MVDKKNLFETKNANLTKNAKHFLFQKGFFCKAFFEKTQTLHFLFVSWPSLQKGFFCQPFFEKIQTLHFLFQKVNKKSKQKKKLFFLKRYNPFFEKIQPFFCQPFFEKIPSQAFFVKHFLKRHTFYIFCFKMVFFCHSRQKSSKRDG